MLTHPKSTMRVCVRYCIWLRATWLCYQVNFTPPKLTLHPTYGAGRPHVGLCPIFLVRPPGTVVPGRLYVLLQFSFSTRNLRGPLADCREILRHARKHVLFYNAGSKIWETAPPQKKNWGYNCHLTWHKVGIITYIQHWGNRPLKIWEGKKRSKFGAIWNNFQVWPRIYSRTCPHIENGKQTW